MLLLSLDPEVAMSLTVAFVNDAAHLSAECTWSRPCRFALDTAEHRRFVFRGSLMIFDLRECTHRTRRLGRDKGL